MTAAPFTDAELQSVVEPITGQAVDAGEWECEQIFEPVVSGTAGIWRVRVGMTSLVVKIVRHSADGHPNWLTGDDPSHWYYWKREVLAYQSGLLVVRAVTRRASPRVRVDRDNGTVALLAGGPRGSLGDCMGSAPLRRGRARPRARAGRVCRRPSAAR